MLVVDDVGTMSSILKFLRDMKAYVDRNI